MKCSGDCKKDKPADQFENGHGGYFKTCAPCRAASRARDARRKAQAVPCSTGCGHIARRRGMCYSCCKRDLYGDCTVDGCARPADGPRGLCSGHRDRGPCEVGGCTNRGKSKVDGRLLCHQHYSHATGRRRPAEYDNSNDPHGMYVWRFLSGVPVYVGISYRADVEPRNWEHLNAVDRVTGERKSPWADHAWAPESFSFVYPTKRAAMDAEEAAIKIATRTFGPLANNRHSPGEGRGLELDEVVVCAAKGRRVWIKFDDIDLGDLECLAIDWALDRELVGTYTHGAESFDELTEVLR